MFTGLLLNLIRIIENLIFKLCLKTFFLCLIIIIYLFCSSQSASILTSSNLSSSNQFEFMSNSSYRNFILRQYFIDLLNISHASLVHSMIYNSHIAKRSIEFRGNDQIPREKPLNDDTLLNIRMFTLQPTDCLIINNQVQTNFIWSHSIEQLESTELIYYIDPNSARSSSISINIKFKYLELMKEIFTINTYVQYDQNRDLYSFNLYEYILQANNQSLLIESIINNETCQTIRTYMIILSKDIRSKQNQILKSNPTLSYDLRQLIETQTDSSSSSACKRKSIQINFEELGLAYLVIRPKEYSFTYCDGSCSYATLQKQTQSAIHTIFRSIVNRKNSNIPQVTCMPSQFADDYFLLRQTDGSIEIYPIKDIIVKQCACL